MKTTQPKFASARTQRRRVAVSPMIAAMARKIVARFDPDRIILFGSHARAGAASDSDVDLLVVMPYRGSRSRVQAELRLALREFPISKDIVVTSPDEFAWRSRISGTIERPAALEGTVLHAR